jgi:hypothetical protein
VSSRTELQSHPDPSEAPSPGAQTSDNERTRALLLIQSIPVAVGVIRGDGVTEITALFRFLALLSSDRIVHDSRLGLGGKAWEDSGRIRS